MTNPSEVAVLHRESVPVARCNTFIKKDLRESAGVVLSAPRATTVGFAEANDSPSLPVYLE